MIGKTPSHDIEVIHETVVRHGQRISALEQGHERSNRAIVSTQQRLSDHENVHAADMTAVKVVVAQMVEARKADREALERNTRAVSDLQKWHQRPIVRSIGTMIGTAIAAYLATKGH